jgi:TPR repeat protein
MTQRSIKIPGYITASLSLLIFFPPLPIYSGPSLDEIWAKAEVGNAAAQVQLGDAYDIGAGVKRDVAEAIKWYRKAAEQGDAEGEYSLGGKYDSGDGVSQDYTEALKWYRKAAEQGHGTAQYNVESFIIAHWELTKTLQKQLDGGARRHYKEMLMLSYP